MTPPGEAIVSWSIVILQWVRIKQRGCVLWWKVLLEMSTRWKTSLTISATIYIYINICICKFTYKYNIYIYWYFNMIIYVYSMSTSTSNRCKHIPLKQNMSSRGLTTKEGSPVTSCCCGQANQHLQKQAHSILKTLICKVRSWSLWGWFSRWRIRNK